MNVLLQFWGPSDDVHEAYVAEAVEVNCFVFHSGVSNHTWQDILSLRSMLGESSGETVARQLSFPVSSSNRRANSAVIMPPIGSVSLCLGFVSCSFLLLFLAGGDICCCCCHRTSCQRERSDHATKGWRFNFCLIGCNDSFFCAEVVIFRSHRFLAPLLQIFPCAQHDTL